MSNYVYNINGGKYNGAAFSAFELEAYGGNSCVASGSSFVCTAGTGLNINISKGQALIKNSENYAYRCGWSTASSVAVSAASTANPRKDTIVAYIDMSKTPDTSVINNENKGIFNIKVVAGTPAADAQAPTNAMIQSAIGSGNPFMPLYDVTVPKSATSLANSVFTDRRNVPLCKIEISTADIEEGSELETGKLYGVIK